MKTKQKKMYVVRYFGKNGSCYSSNVGKGKLFADRHKAARVAKRLKKSGVDAIIAPMMITA